MGSAAAKRSELAELREIAELRAEAIMRATERVLEAVLQRPAWREFEYVWFERRLEDARRSLASAPAPVRFGFIERLRGTLRVLREATDDRFVGAAAALMVDALTRLFDAFEGREDRPLTTSEEVYAAAERVRQAGGHPFFDRHSRTVRRLPNAKAIARSVWVVHQQPEERSYGLSHAPSGSLVTLPRLPKPKIEAIARSMAKELPDYASDAPLLHEVPGGRLGTRLVGGMEREQVSEVYRARDRALASLGITW